MLGRPWSETNLGRESTNLYPAHASFPMDPCGQTSLLAHSRPWNLLITFLSRIYSVLGLG